MHPIHDRHGSFDRPPHARSIIEGMAQVLRRLIDSLGAEGAVANVAASLEDRRVDLAAVEQACLRLASGPVEQATAA